MTDHPAQHERAETRVLIYGSCVSRDTIEFLPDTYRLVTYVARQSAISVGAPAQGVQSRLRQLPSAFQNRMVSGDVRGDLVTVLERHADDVDLLLVDLIDERGGVIPVGGGYVTKLSEMWGAGGREVAAGLPRLEFGTDEHFETWARAFTAVVRELDRLGLKSRTAVLRTPWARLAPDGTTIPIPDWMTDPGTANRLYSRYFDRVARLGLEIIELPDDLARSPLDHRWGPSPFHYTESAYRFLASRIDDFVASVTAADAYPDDVGTVEPLQRLPERFLHVPRRDATPWGAPQVFTSVDELSQAPVHDGLVTIATEVAPLDLLIEDNAAATTIVSLHAAMGQKPMDLPIFTGRSVTQGLPVNRIFVSDASLCLDPDLKLAWYLGAQGLDLTHLLHQVIVALQARFAASHLVFFGMSGGGFAALNLAHTFAGSLAVPVNAQTRITDYHQPAWEAYMAACFGTVGEAGARAALDAHPRADLRAVYSAGFANSVIYLQNSQDAHVTSQLTPWLQSLPHRERVYLLLREWGRGHVPPSAGDLRSLMQQVAGVGGDWEALAGRWDAIPASSVDSPRRMPG